jgi:hypothetical protein
MELEITLKNNDTLKFLSDGAHEEIGTISSARYVPSRGTEYSIPARGDIADMCDAYPLSGARGAVLTINRGAILYCDSLGRGSITSITSDNSDARTIMGSRMADVARAFCRRSGKSLFRIVGGSIYSSHVKERVASCDSLIKNIVDSSSFGALQVLHAQIPAKAAPGVVQRYALGGDILHLFTSGKGVLHRTADGKFESVPFEIAGKEKWVAIVVAPQEYYQVINTSPDRNLEYFWMFLDHENAYNRGAVHSLTQNENLQAGWGFICPN